MKNILPDFAKLKILLPVSHFVGYRGDIHHPACLCCLSACHAWLGCGVEAAVFHFSSLCDREPEEKKCGFILV